MHVWIEDFAELSRHLRRHRDSQIACSGCDSIWQNQPGRVRHGFVYGKFSYENDAQSVGLVACCGWIQWRAVTWRFPVTIFSLALGLIHAVNLAKGGALLDAISVTTKYV